MEVLRVNIRTSLIESSNEKYINPEKNFESYFITHDTGSSLELMRRPDIIEHKDPENQYLGLTHLAYEVDRREMVDLKAKELQGAGFPILNGPRITGDGYYEFETLDPDNNRIEVTCST